MIVRNVIAESDDGRRHERPLERVVRLVVHRVSRARDHDKAFGIEPIPDDELTGPLVAAWFRDRRPYRPGAYTSGETPYGLVLRTDGVIDQCCGLGDMTPHALRWSASGVGLGVVGDFRRHAPTEAQQSAIIDLGAHFLAWGCGIVGHDELPGSSSDPAKICPGRHLGVSEVARLAQARRVQLGLGTIEAAEAAILAVGLVF